MGQVRLLYNEHACDRAAFGHQNIVGAASRCGVHNLKADMAGVKEPYNLPIGKAQPLP